MSTPWTAGVPRFDSQLIATGRTRHARSSVNLQRARRKASSWCEDRRVRIIGHDVDVVELAFLERLRARGHFDERCFTDAERDCILRRAVGSEGSSARHRQLGGETAASRSRRFRESAINRARSRKRDGRGRGSGSHHRCTSCRPAVRPTAPRRPPRRLLPRRL